MSIRPGWFYHSTEDDRVKQGPELFDLYLRSVGRGANLLLNVPPDRRGLIHEKDSAALMDFKNLREKNFSNNLLKQANTYWEFGQKDFFADTLTFRSFDGAPEAYGINVQHFIVQFQQPTKINTIVLREAIHLGQSVRQFRIVLYNNTKLLKELTGTTVGRKRILTFPSETITSFKVYLDDVNGNDNISGVAAYLIDEKLINRE